MAVRPGGKPDKKSRPEGSCHEVTEGWEKGVVAVRPGGVQQFKPRRGGGDVCAGRQNNGVRVSIHAPAGGATSRSR